MFHKVLVANRGEIAVRIIRACRELDIRTVAVYSTADADSLHVRLADEKVCIGPPQLRDSYLNIPAIISAAEITDSEAIHPGYGFLAENPQFADICEDCGVTFIGPKMAHLLLMGNKVKAREVVKKTSVRVLPGSDGVLKEEKDIVAAAKDIGFPVVIKAAMGGGGRGMKVVHTPASLGNAFQTARSEAMAAFNDGSLYLEKYFERARHIEVQILADMYGNVIHLGERDCSIQRRNQKIIEESPSIALSSRLREKIDEAAVTVCKAVDYSNIGTVEFLLDGEGNFYFMEMNTRLQVEHPVTECVSGIDIVQEQIRLASGERLSMRQRDVNLKGHSIECRVNAEDPETLAPSPGKVTSLNLSGGFGVRVDTALFNGYEVSPLYDSLLAKVIVHADDREKGIKRMRRALEEIIIDGVKTNIPLHLKVLSDADFLDGNIHTRFLERFL